MHFINTPLLIPLVQARGNVRIALKKASWPSGVKRNGQGSPVRHLSPLNLGRERDRQTLKTSNSSLPPWPQNPSPFPFLSSRQFSLSSLSFNALSVAKCIMSAIRGFLNVFKARSSPVAAGRIINLKPLSDSSSSARLGRAFLERCNPFRDIPRDAKLENTLCEVRYIDRTLRDLMVPTSLPGDDYNLCSKLLRSLETRRDLTWLVLRETDIRDTISAIARRGGRRAPIPDEPLDLHSRVKALERHWSALEKCHTKLREWEPRYATQPQPPLLEGQEEYDLDLTDEQATHAEIEYREWRSDRDRKVSYLKLNPPEPSAFVPVERRDIQTDETWSVLPASDGHFGKRLLPIWTPIVFQEVPLDWESPEGALLSTRAERRRRDEFRRRENNRREKKYEFQRQLQRQMAEA